MRKVFLLTLAVIIGFASTLVHTGKEVYEASSLFKDVNSYEVNLLAQQKIVQGYTDQTFRPNNPVTRAEAVTMIGRALGFDETKRETTFPDVPLEHFASGLIAEGVEKGIVTGYGDGTFRPRTEVTRGEMAVFINRAFALEKTRTATFSDIRPQMFSYQSIIRLAESGITVGYSDGTFRPDRSITRLEFALFLARAIYPDLRPKPKAPEVIAFGTVINAPEGLNVRTGPGATHPALEQRLPNGTTVNIYSIQNNWAHMEALGVTGYVSLNHIKVDHLSATGALSGITLVVDPGHGGRDSGASGNGLVEKVLVLEVSLLLRNKLQAAGANVIMTRSTDVFLELADRAKIANDAKADAFISIHANSFTNGSVHGTETYWFDKFSGDESKELAETIQKHLISKLRTVDRKAKKGNFHVIRETQMPSVLVELGFLSNKAEADYMKTAAFKEAAAEAILLGVLEFYAK
ncbi:hypothetical protein DS745_04950 [Anaerobacillus alkaliphilus]|uniref:SLH domain-containing protein n=1 Tax=Anaerobacillus alkaliphilus TaxID=1548597 RepID=A0A4Q0VWH9_9BACI|nr:N-acetylmuramoyl-L-alanine amidase [Anaerobacillus alkaliphilus]RXJ02936.1 hypothetical protein DS745_04950 [Anaerobacillus alkaliphilus]